MYCTILLEIVHLEANIPVSLLSHPAKVDWVFPNRQADVGRRRCKTCSQSNQTLHLVQLGPLSVRSVIVKLCTSIKCGGAILLDGLSIPCSSAAPQVEAVVAVAVQALQGEVGDHGVVYCLHLHGAVITLHNWPQRRQKKTLNHYLSFNTSLWVTYDWLMSIIMRLCFWHFSSLLI